MNIKLFKMLYIAAFTTTLLVIAFTLPPIFPYGFDAQSAISHTISENDNININTAVLTELMCLDGIGEVKAQRIIDYRTQNGAFTSVDELEKINGFSKNTVDAIRDKICV